MTDVTSAVTPKGERRRCALVGAAADLLREGGFDAVRHRSVARRAGVPLASTTYYFRSLDDLIDCALAHVGDLETAQLHARVDALSRRRRGAEATSEVLVDLMLGGVTATPTGEQPISRYERYLACARQPRRRELQRGLRRLRTEAVGEAVDRSGRAIPRTRLAALMCAVDGAVVSALVEDGAAARSIAKATLADVIDVLAPLV